MNLVPVSKVVGHDDVEVSMKYLHPDTSKAAVKANQRIRGKPLYLLEAAS
jgi:hypothetical protein